MGTFKKSTNLEITGSATEKDDEWSYLSGILRCDWCHKGWDDN